MNEELIQPSLTGTFAALGDPTRFAIVERLLENGEQSATSLQDVADISAPAISRHLKVLRVAGLIEQRIDRQRRMYSVKPAALAAINGWTMNHKDFWMSSLDRLEKALEKDA
jgi:DNA-binding transcriptional ArsR family regulator